MRAREIEQGRANGPLAGRTVLVTRAREQAAELTARLEAEGATVVEFAAIRFADPESWKPLDGALARINSYDWIVFTSVNGVRQVCRRLEATGGDVSLLRGRRLAAIGPATARALEAKGLDVALVPREYRAEGLSEAFADVPMNGARVLVPRAAVARDVLPSALRSRGAQVDVVPVYRTERTQNSIEPLRSLLANRAIDVVTFASSGTVQSFLEAIGEDAVRLLDGVTVAAIGPVTAETARSAGLHVAIVARRYTIAGLVQSVVGARDDDPSRRIRK
jgi:uroporphyrinogen III methyltransferase/synthase